MNKKENPKVSIVVPVYNAEKYLEVCVNSILVQDYKNIEVILVNDGSTDNSPAICDALKRKDNRVSVIHKSNEGGGIARNVGVDHASGEWIIFEDADDFWNKPEGLKELINLVRKIDYQFDFLIFNYTRYFQKDNKYVERPNFPSQLTGFQEKTERINSLFQNQFIPAPPWGKLINLNFLKTNSIRFEKGISAEDIPWFIQLLEKSENFALTNIRFHVYRKQVPGALTNSFKPEKFDGLMEIVKKESERLKIDSKKKKENHLLLSFLAYQYIILLATSSNFKGKTFWQKQRELTKIKWLLNYDRVKKVRLIKKTIRFLPVSLISIIMHFYAKKIVNKN